MRVTLEWLEEFLAGRLNAGKLAEQLTMAGLEVERVEESRLGPALEVSITANRGDCLSVMGLSYEISAITGIPLKKMHIPKPVRSVKGDAPVNIKTPKLCTRYCGQIMEGVRMGPSPKWMRERLEACGVRSINNVVDVTNYVMLELGQPLHAFDLDRLDGEGIQVRRARPEEILVTLDGKERRLNSDDLVIADKQRPVALAGVMGGLNSEIHEGTKRLFLESACFDPGTVRRTSKRLGLQSESSYRFERGVDWFRVREAIDRMSDLLEETAGASRAGVISDIFRKKPPTVRISFNPKQVSSLLGGKWSVREIERPLKRLGCSIQKSSARKWWVISPSRRHDLRQSVDIVEEVARLKGYENIESEIPHRLMKVTRKTHSRFIEDSVKQHLTRLGFSECIHFSFCSEEGLKKLGEGWTRKAPALANPLSQETAFLRPTLLLSLISVVQYHQRRQMMNLRFFELRSVFYKEDFEIKEKRFLSGILAGESEPRHWSRKKVNNDFYEAKGVVEGIFQVFEMSRFFWDQLEAKDPYEGIFHPNRSARISLEDQVIGVVGELHPEKESAFELRGPILAFEINWDALSSFESRLPRYREVSNVPWVERDLALLLDESVRAEEVRNIIKESDERLIHNILIFDVYRGEQIPKGKKSLAFTYRIGHPNQTLKDEEVEAIQEKIVSTLKNRLQVEIR